MKSFLEGSLHNTEINLMCKALTCGKKCGNDYFTSAKYKKPKELD